MAGAPEAISILAFETSLAEQYSRCPLPLDLRSHFCYFQRRHVPKQRMLVATVNEAPCNEWQRKLSSTCYTWRNVYTNTIVAELLYRLPVTKARQRHPCLDTRTSIPTNTLFLPSTSSCWRNDISVRAISTARGNYYAVLYQ